MQSANLPLVCGFCPPEPADPCPLGRVDVCVFGVVPDRGFAVVVVGWGWPAPWLGAPPMLIVVA
jgi:hypothetical protein